MHDLGEARFLAFACLWPDSPYLSCLLAEANPLA